MSLPRAQFRYHEYSTVGNFLGFAKKINPNISQTLLIFPSHSNHHAKNSTLYSRKAGMGRVNLTYAKADLKIPTLGLPIVGIAVLNPQDPIPELAKKAVADLWKAAGFGINLVLPVRRQMNKHYFHRGLHDFSSHEPEFWGFHNEEPNPLLAEYYLEQLQLLQQYLAAEPGKKPALPDSLLAAYQEGERARQAAVTPAWFSTNPKLWQLNKKPQAPSPELTEQPEQEQEACSPLSRPTPSASPIKVLADAASKVQAVSRPSYESLYKAQEKARWWKTALAITVGILTLPTLILPVLSYVLWRRSKENELIQKFEMSPNEYKTLKDARHALAPPKLINESQVKPHKEVSLAADQDTDKKAVYYLDKAQARRLRFFAERVQKGKGAALTADECARLTLSKEESVKLRPSLGYN